MISTVFFCATTVLCLADNSVQSQPTPAPQVTTKPPASKTQAQAVNAQHDTAGEKKPEPKAHVAYRPQTDPPKTETKPEQKAEKKLELLPIEQSIIDYTNAERARFGLPTFVVDANLMATARRHCTWMTTYRQLVHTNIGVAENIAMGQPSSQDVVRCWMNSSGHRANILNGGHRRIGVAAYRTPEGTIYWCQQFTP